MTAASISAGQMALVKTDRFSLQFSADGRPASLKTADGKELLNVADPGAGFAACGAGGMVIPLNRVRVEGQTLIASSDNATQQVHLAVKSGTGHIGLQIVRLIGFATTGDLALTLEMKFVDDSVRALPYDPLTRVTSEGKTLKVSWPHLWQRTIGDAPGGFSIYLCTSDAGEDDTLLHIWADQPLPHPAVEGAWTYDRAKQWLAAWQKRFGDRTPWPQFAVFYLEPTKPQDLYDGAKYAKAAGVSAVYLMPWSWRGEYWPDHKTTAGINTDIFPAGEADLEEYSNHLAAMGLGLELHYVSGGIGFHNPRYVGTKPDRRLASWGGGKLAAAVSARDRTLKFRPAAGVEAPFVLSDKVNWGAFDYRPPALPHWMGCNIVRIEDELVQVGSFEDTDKEVWTLKDCRRGFGSTTAAAHGAGADSAGLVVAYGQNLVPENNSTLLSEIAADYAGLLNRCRITQAILDGIEIHNFFGAGHDEKFAAEVYSRLDHPTVCHTSSGRAPRAWLEYRFNSTRKLQGPSRGGHADIILDQPSRPASSILDAHHQLSAAAARGTHAFGIRSSDRGPTVEALKTHGRTDAIIQAVNDWRAVSYLLTDVQREKFTAAPSTSNHFDPGWAQGDQVYVPRRTAGGWKIVPLKVLTRKSGDVKWFHGQEHGAVGPRQYIKPGEKLSLENPFKAQAAQFVIRVLYAHDYDSDKNLSLQPTITEITNPSDTLIRSKGAGLELTLDNQRAVDRWEVSQLPAFHRPVDMLHRRAIGMYVTGDAGGATLLLHALPTGGHGRDWVVKLDFKGRRYVESPSGEAAWANADWGWRYACAKTFDYGRAHDFLLGYGHVPPLTKASALVEGIKALAEIPAMLENPVIHTGAGTLTIKGRIASGQYLEYTGAATAALFDANWNKLAELPVEARQYVMPSGVSDVWVASAAKTPQPWLEVQFMAEGAAILVPDKSKLSSPRVVRR
ncbi:MAG: hypothetical protein ABFD92_07600 [Planctomycetaceae bacterium]